ncbi:GntR family transcriptional regulator [Microtetraspora malaysiensis]|uniref:GntR family transcriptional regulator n=1 Tax=Microtetraspora malaysiensis TaxID=161358 RepID=UPI003D93AF6B
MAEGVRESSTSQLMAERAYVYIRDQIVTVGIPPGSPVDEEKLMRELGVGRTPVREALKRLSVERLVTVYPRRGTFASEIQLDDELWLTEVRVPLEGLAADRAARRASAKERRTLERLSEDITREIAGGADMLPLVLLDAEIHRAVYRAAHNPYLESTLTTYLNLGMRIWFHRLSHLPDLSPHVLDQREVIAAILERDGDLARRTAEDHLQGCSHSIRSNA